MSALTTVSSFEISITFTSLMPERHDLANGRRGERLEGARHGRLAIEHVGNQHLGRELFFTELLAELEGLDVVEELDHFLVGAVAERAEESGREEFPAALAAIEIDVEQIARVELHFDPGAAIRNDAEAVEHLAVEMDARFEAMPGERCNWLTTTRSAPLMTNVPCGVMSGISPM